MKLTTQNIKKIGILRALQLGDMLCAVPALRALRHAFPNADITLIGLPWAAQFVDRFSGYLDTFIHFPGYPGLPEQEFNRDDWSRFVNNINSQQFDLLLQMQGNGNIVNSMLRDSFPVMIAGFHSEGNRMDPDLFLNYPEGISEIDRHLALMEHLGIPSCGRHLEFPVLPAEKEKLKTLNLPVSEKSYVCIHPGSRGSWRQWPVSHFANIADEAASLGYDIVVTGTKEEQDLTMAVISKMNRAAIDLTGRTGLGEVGELINQAALLISNCTGVSHIAAAMRTPSIVISMDGEPERWGPINQKLHRTIDWTKTQQYETVSAEMHELLSSPTVIPSLYDPSGL